MFKEAKVKMKPKDVPSTTSKLISHQELRRYFETEARRLQGDIQKQLELIKAPGETRGELLDEVNETTEQAQSIGVLEQLNKELNQVQVAQKRLASGKYGICQDCGQRIPRARLQVQPCATRCVQCATQYSRRAR